MTDAFLPAPVTVARIRYRYADSVGVSGNPYNGIVRTASRGGDRLGISLELTPQGGGSSSSQAARRRLISTLAGLRGRGNRIYLYDQGYRQAGSFPATELLTNNDFSNGTTGWSATGSATIAVSNGVLRATRTAYNLSSGGGASAATAAMSAYVPHAIRAFVAQTSRTGASNAGPVLYDVAANGISNYGALGMRSAMLVPLSTGIGSVILNDYAEGTSTYDVAGAWTDFSWCSVSRCILADNGPNGLLYSDQVDNAAWTKSGCTVSANAHTAPDGTATADGIIEDTSTGGHYFSQTASRSSQAEDLVVYGYFSTIASGRDVRLVIGADGSSDTACFFNLTAGTVGAITNNGSMTNGRAFIVPAGNGWYFCCLIARAPATTSMIAYAYMASSGTANYTGTGSGRIGAWRVGAARSSVPTRGALTTTAATTGTAQTGGSLFVKGLPVSTLGLLWAGDMVEITTSLGTQLVILTVDLDGDAAGKGLLRFSPPIRGSVADNAVIFVNNPMARCIFAGDSLEWITEPGIITTASIDLEESPT